MIPLQLTIEGLYSYQEKQTIDFSDLTNAGLFGILGAVGSGKSSILEAITFALYGETERLNNRDRRAYNMMNLKSDHSLIIFDFKNHENRVFRAKRAFRRNSKQFEDVKPKNDVVFYEKIGSQWQPLEYKDATPLLGNLNYRNFKRTIIIPQGQFKEFLELKHKDRTKMMMDIFSLERFNLKVAASALRQKNIEELSKIEGKLEGLETVNEEKVKQQTQVVQDRAKVVADMEKSFEKCDHQFQQLKAVKEDFEIFKQKQKDFQTLKQKQPAVEQQDKDLKLYEHLYHIFHPLFKEKKQVDKIFTQKEKEAENQAEIVKMKVEDLEKKSAKLEKIKPQQEALPQKRREEEDLKLLIQIRKYQQDNKDQIKRRKKGEKEVQKAENEESDMADSIKNMETKADELSENQLSAKILMAVNDWFSKKNNLAERVREKQNELTQKEQELHHIIKTLEAKHINPANFEDDYKKFKKQSALEKKALQDQSTHLKLQEKLSDYADNLHHGEPCPLCGSLEHPNIAEIEDTQEELKKIEEKINGIEKQDKTQQDFFIEATNLVQQKEKVKIEVVNAQKTVTQKREELKQHQQQFIWPEFDSDNRESFEKKKAAEEQRKDNIQTLHKTLSQKRKKLEKLRETVERYKEEIDKIQTTITSNEAKVSENKNHLKILSVTDFEQKTAQQITETLNQLKLDNDKTEKDFDSLNNKCQKLDKDLAGHKADLKSTQNRVEELKDQKTTIDNATQKALEEEHLASIEKVEKILAQARNVEQERDQINQFNRQFAILENQVNHLKNKLNAHSFKEEEYNKVQQKQKELKVKLAKDNKQLTEAETELKRLNRDIKNKRAFLSQKEKLSRRGDNLKTLFNLFKGDGFVKYASSIYLSQLCENANTRFRRMTKNQLSLQLDDRNDFEVIDALNEGKHRSVKTLSGGQSFQASLSLALALAESVQADAKAKKNFFFIDEGFGTQDRESVNIVFDTLLNLQKENRIVGIISHVEGLKEKIPISLTITKDEERGSQIGKGY